MATKKPASKKPAAGKEQMSEMIAKLKDSSHDVLLAGLGALARTRKGDKGAHKKRSNDYGALVAEGRRLEPEFKASMQKAWSEFAEKRGKLTAPAGFDGGRLQGVLQERVAAAVKLLGIPAKKDYDALSRKVDRLIAAAEGKQRAPARKAAAKAPAARKGPARKGAVKKRAAKTVGA
jgi:poly(hydroxyalkanoate) granule-associated protein